MRRILCALVTVSFALLCPPGADAAGKTSGSCGDTAYWQYANGVLTISGSGAINDYSDDEFSTTYASPWRQNDLVLQIKKIVVGEGMTRIGKNAFARLQECTEAVLPSTISEIADGAFEYCGRLQTFSLPETVTGLSFGADCFFACWSLQTFTVPAGTAVIPGSMFASCSGLSSVSLPDGLRSIYQNAFWGCRALKTISIPETVTGIGDSAFRESGLTGIEVPGSVRNIGRYAFQDAVSLAEVELNEGLYGIGTKAFYGCTSLAGITIPVSVTTIDSNAIPYNAVPYVYCNSPASRMGLYHAQVLHTQVVTDAAVEPDCIHTGLTEGSHCGNCGAVITAQTEVEALGHDTLVVPGQAATMRQPGWTDGLYCGRCKEWVRQQAAIPAYGEMEEADLRLPGDLRTIEAEAFAGVDAQVILLPEGVTALGDRAFADCESLRMINIPDSVTEIGEDLFRNCGEGLLVYGTEESAAREAAGENGCIFVLMD